MIEPIIYRHLEPLARGLSPSHAGPLTWASLAIALCAAFALAWSYQFPFLAAAGAILLVVHLLLNTLARIAAEQQGKAEPSWQLVSEFSDRMSDVAILLGLTFSPLVDKMVGLLVIICVLMVSYVGVLGQALACQRIRIGVLGKAERTLLLAATCLLYAVDPQFDFRGYTAFGILFLVFIPLASLTLLQRLDRVLTLLNDRK